MIYDHDCCPFVGAPVGAVGLEALAVAGDLIPDKSNILLATFSNLDIACQVQFHYVDLNGPRHVAACIEFEGLANCRQ